jgi:hypothetical protein
MKSAPSRPRTAPFKERPMTDNPIVIEKKIADLRELMRCTLDRTKHAGIRERIMEELEKLKTLGGKEN